MSKKRNSNRKPRFKHLDARVTLDEYNLAKKKADDCGLTLSMYVRKCALGHEPKLHLTEREIEAYNHIGDARGDIVNIFKILRKRSPEERDAYFRDASFMNAWLQGSAKVMLEWDKILEGMKE